MNTLVPTDMLQPDTLQSLIEDFVTRDGAVQGHQDRPLAEKAQAVERALRSGRAVLLFNDVDEMFTIVSAAEWERASEADRAGDATVDDYNPME